MSIIEIQHGELRAGIAPNVGGSLAYFRNKAGHDLVRPAPQGADDPLQFGCFPLVPYSNRIRDGRFSFGGQSIQLPLNFGDHPHSIHGHGWQNPWQIMERMDDRVSLRYRHEADRWPFPYTAEQSFCLNGDGLTIALQLTNTGETAMPCGLGLHPYFPATPQTRLQAFVDGVWLTDDEVMPTDWAHLPDRWRLSAGCVVGQMACDNLFTGWNGMAQITWPERGLGLTLRASGNLGYLVVYAPTAEGFFCAEPVSHRTDAFNSGDDAGARVLDPGEVLSAQAILKPFSL